MSDELKWMGREIVKPEDAKELERESAILEFSGKHSRHEAENLAYQKYNKNQHHKAAAHHLSGMKAADASGNKTAAHDHFDEYQRHLISAGHSAKDGIPEEVLMHVKAGVGSDLYSFKNHHADVLGKSEMDAEGGITGDGILCKSGPELHGSVDGFMGGLKALPKEGPARGMFITRHMNHAPFLTALGSHPQGTQIKGMLNAHLNSRANAGFKGGTTKILAKTEKELANLLNLLCEI